MHSLVLRLIRVWSSVLQQKANPNGRTWFSDGDPHATLPSPYIFLSLPPVPAVIANGFSGVSWRLGKCSQGCQVGVAACFMHLNEAAI
jgi:hypothetical protein